MKKIVIFGTGNFAKVVHFYLTNDSHHKVAAFTANNWTIKDNQLFGLPIIPFENVESIYPPSKFSMFIAVGYLKMNKTRAEICNQAKEKGYELITYVNSKATTWGDLTIGGNSFIFENNVIQPYVKIGDDVIIWSGNHIGHHTTIGDHCFISSHVVISGNVIIGPYCFFGVNSTIRDGIKIAPECVIGAGTIIMQNTKKREIYSVRRTKPRRLTSDKLKHL